MQLTKAQTSLCAADQCLFCSLSGKFNSLTCNIPMFNILASLCRRVDWFEDCFARTPKDMFSRNKAHIKAMETKDQVHSVGI